MTRQYFPSISADPPLVNQTAITATVETALWNAAQYTPIAANDPAPGKIYEVTAGGIMSFAGTGTLILTPRFGLTVAAGISMGPNVVAVTTPGVLTAHPWRLKLTVIVQQVGLPGVNAKVNGTGEIVIGAPGAAGQAVAIAFGGTQASVDVSIPTGICIGWTLSVAGTVTPIYAFIEAKN